MLDLHLRGLTVVTGCDRNCDRYLQNVAINTGFSSGRRSSACMQFGGATLRSLEYVTILQGYITIWWCTGVNITFGSLCQVEIQARLVIGSLNLLDDKEVQLGELEIRPVGIVIVVND